MVKLIKSEVDDGIYIDKFSRSPKIFTKNLVPGKSVYGERLFSIGKDEYRQWDPHKSKLGAAICKDIKLTGFKSGDIVLYLGASSGTTVSHVSDIVGHEGFIFALDVAPQTTRDLVFLCEDRKNIVPILADAALPFTYVHKIPQVDFLFQDIAQRSQVEIFLKNIMFLRKGGYGMLSLKCRCMDVTKNPKQVFEIVLKELKKTLEVVDFKNISDYEIDHYIFLVKKNY